MTPFRLQAICTNTLKHSKVCCRVSPGMIASNEVRGSCVARRDADLVRAGPLQQVGLVLGDQVVHSSGGPADARSTLTNLRRARDVFEKRRTLGSTDSYCPCTHQDPATDHLLVQTIEEGCAA